MPCMVVESAPVFTPVANRGTVYRPTEALVLSSLHRCLEDVRSHRMHATADGARPAQEPWIAARIQLQQQTVHALRIQSLPIYD